MVKQYLDLPNDEYSQNLRQLKGFLGIHQKKQDPEILNPTVKPAAKEKPSQFRLKIGFKPWPYIKEFKLW